MRQVQARGGARRQAGIQGERAGDRRQQRRQQQRRREQQCRWVGQRVKKRQKEDGPQQKQHIQQHLKPLLWLLALLPSLLRIKELGVGYLFLLCSLLSRREAGQFVPEYGRQRHEEGHMVLR